MGYSGWLPSGVPVLFRETFSKGDLALFPTTGRLPRGGSHLKMGTAHEAAVREIILTWTGSRIAVSCIQDNETGCWRIRKS
jgi:hypothetical protein